MNIALFSPSQNPYSETFIQAHKKFLSGNVFYYYGSRNAISLENHRPISSKLKRLVLKGYQVLTKKDRFYSAKKIVGDSLIRNKIDIVLVEYANHANGILPIIEDLKLPMVVHFHGYDASVKNIVAANKSYKELFAYASRIVVVSKKMEIMVSEMGCPSKKILLNTYGPQPEFETVVPQFSKKQFIGIGRFTDKKAPYYTILAFQKVLNKHPDAMLLLAGNGALKNMCVNLVKYLDIEENVNFLGVITPEEYRGILSQSRAFVQHSITANNGDMEGTPLAVLEASVAGLPVVSTKHAGIPDVIQHNETGLLCEEHDVNAMSENMLNLLDDIELSKNLGQQGRKNILQNFSLQKHISSLNSVLKLSVNKG